MVSKLEVLAAQKVLAQANLESIDKALTAEQAKIAAEAPQA